MHIRILAPARIIALSLVAVQAFAAGSPSTVSSTSALNPTRQPSSAPHTSDAQQIPTLAVMDLEGRQIDSGSLEVLRDALIVELQNNHRMRVMERSQMNKILAEQGFQKSGACDGSECAVEVGRLLAVDRMLLGTVGKLGGSWSITLRLVSVQTGEVLASVRDTKEGKIDELLKESIPSLAAQVIARSSGEAPIVSPETSTIPNYVEALKIIEDKDFRNDEGMARLKATSDGLKPAEAFQLYQRGEISGSWAWFNGFMPYLPLGSMIKGDWRGTGYIYALLIPVIAATKQDNSTLTAFSYLLWWGFAIGRPIWFASNSNSHLRQGLHMESSAWVPTPNLGIGRDRVAMNMDWHF